MKRMNPAPFQAEDVDVDESNALLARTPSTAAATTPSSHNINSLASLSAKKKEPSKKKHSTPIALLLTLLSILALLTAIRYAHLITNPSSSSVTHSDLLRQAFANHTPPLRTMCSGKTVKSEREQLPQNVKPVHYDLTLIPNFDTFNFTGSVHVDLEVCESTNTIVLHTNEVTISKAKLISFASKSESAHEAESIDQDKSKQTTAIKFAEALPSKSKAKLSLEFNGFHNDKMSGFYRSSYTDTDGQKQHLVVSQFEPTDARRAFPCWDEPALKATFDVTLKVPKDKVALSNMNVVEDKTEGDLKVVKFAKSPIMSTYLLAFAVGDFAYIEAYTSGKHNKKPIQCRIYTLKGSEKQGEFALKVKIQALEYFAEIFGIAYPLPKCDSLAVPDFEAGAMENWGLITFRTTALLFDEKQSSARSKQAIAYTMSHELAHQWFGNLVTMEWWSHLWLNEGFATWVGYLAVDHIFPDWDIFTQFVMEGLQSGLTLDALRSSHPIEVEVSHPSEIHQIFDAISYYKGASVIRMLAASLSLPTFLKGVSAYLKRHSYSNASTDDLWKALSEVSGVDVGEYMQAWTRSIGHPVVKVEKLDAQQIKVSQTRYLSSGDVKPEEDTTLWWVPLRAIDGKSEPSTDILRTKESTLTLPGGTADGFFKLNANQTGVYRVSYPIEVVEKLGAAIAKGGILGTSDRVGILTDTGALAVSGYAKTTAVLTLLKSFQKEQEYIVWSEVASRISDISSVWYDEPEEVRDAIDALQRELFSPQVLRLGWDYPEKEDFLTAMLRTLAIGRAAKAKDSQVIAECIRRFALFRKGDESAIHPNLRGTVFQTAIEHGSVEDYDAVVAFYKRTTIPDQKTTALAALGAATDPELIRRTLAFAISDDVRQQDIIYSLGPLGNNRLAIEPLWEFTKDHWTLFQERYANSMALLGHCVKMSTRFATAEKADEVEAFFGPKNLKAIARPLQQSLERIRANAKWLSRDRASVAEWLSTHVTRK